ncbi:phage tail protein [Xenorhabdus bovienii]|uniref:phage tail protein n=3 Tax=Xenorhabdus bovienii TaxID=40576 RepID=UPI00237C8CB9|nr:phage tail protein [Xenorhabdus bovienii]
MAKNEFLPFGIADGANVLTNEEYDKLAARTNGFSSGVAKSQELNKVWRQASVIANVVAQFIAETNNQDVLDNGNTEALRAGLLNALRATVGSNIPVASQTTAGIAKLSNATNSEAENVAATPKAVKAAYDFANAANNNANGRVPSGRKVNGKALSEDIHLKASDVDAYNKGETDIRVKEAKALANARLEKNQNGADIQNKPAFVNNLGLSELVYRTIGNGYNQIPDMNSFSAGDGHLSFPSGIIIQYGYTPSSTEPKIINFPRPFPAQCFGVTSSGTDPDAANISGCGAIDRFGFYLSAWHVGTETINRTVTINRTATHISWIAIGI